MRMTLGSYTMRSVELMRYGGLIQLVFTSIPCCVELTVCEQHTIIKG